MKKLSKIIMSLALVLILALPLFVGGCFFGGSKEKIELHTEFKTEYIIGEQLDVTNGKILYTDKDGNETLVAITIEMVSSFTTDTAGDREMIVTYQGKTILVDYTVSEPAFPIENGVFKYEQWSGDADISCYLYFEASNVVKFSQGSDYKIIAEGSYTKTYDKTNGWTVNVTLTPLLDGYDDIHIVIKNVTPYSFTAIMTGASGETEMAFTTCEVPADIEFDVVYCHENSSMGTGNDYLTFTSYTNLKYIVAEDYTDGVSITVTRSIEDNKIVYSGSIQNGVDFTITIEDENTLTMYVIINNDVNNSTTFTLIKID